MKKTQNSDSQYYFAEREEQAVIDYIRSNDAMEKNRIYNEILKEPFRKMIQSIIRKYPINIGSYTIKEVESDALTHLIDQMVKYNPDTITKFGNKTKAYSYCQTIVRNFCKDHSKRTNTEKKINLSFDDYIDEIDEDLENSYEMEVEPQNDLDILIDNVTDKIEKVIDEESETLKKNEVVVGDAIVNILRNWHILFMEDTPEGAYNKRVTNKFAKNKILLYLKEQTGLSTKEIRIAIKPFKEIYFIEKSIKLDD